MTAEQRYAARGNLTAATVKKLVRERDGDSCVECGMSAVAHLLQHGRQLEVHRIVPGSLYTVAGCVTLCMMCHDSKPQRAAGEPNMEPGGFMLRLPRAYHELVRDLAASTGCTITDVLKSALDAHLVANEIEPPS